MAVSGPKPESLPQLAIAIQIDTTLHRSKIGVSHGFQRFDHSFNRTVVIRKLKKIGHPEGCPHDHFKPVEKNFSLD
jgi:hypothetical protein